MDKKLLHDLQKIYAAGDILAGAEYGYMAEDESHAITGNPSCIVTPRTHQQVVDTVLWAKTNKIMVIPSGGRTGLSGGACAGNGEVVLSLSKLARIIGFDPVDGLVTVEAGVTLADLQSYVADKGWFYPVDYASKGSAQMGGAVATNAGGLRVLRYGMTRDWVAGLKAVTGNGETLEINRNLIKDNAGYDLKDLIIGSEGTLAVITEVTLRLTRPMPLQRTLLVGVDSLAELVHVFTRARDLASLSAAEFFCDNALRHVCEKHLMVNPFSRHYGYYLLIEHDEEFPKQGLLDEMLSKYDVIVSENPRQTTMLWRLRELISSTINPRKPYKNDIACRLSILGDWLADIEMGFYEISREVEFVWFGHLGDGNLHLNVMKPDTMSSASFNTFQADFDLVIARVTRKYSATASGEHGIGILKKGLLATSRSADEINLYRQIKSVFDPEWILNPGKVLDRC